MYQPTKTLRYYYHICKIAKIVLFSQFICIFNPKGGSQHYGVDFRFGNADFRFVEIICQGR